MSKILKNQVYCNQKELYNMFELYLKNLQKKGMFFFSLQVNMFTDFVLCAQQNKIDYNTDQTPQELMNATVYSINKSLSQIEFIDFSFITVENNKESDSEHVYNLNILLGVRSILEESSMYEIHILTEFKGIFSDIELKPLKTYFEITNYFKKQSNQFTDYDTCCNNFYFTMFSPVNKNIHYDLIDIFYNMSYESEKKTPYVLSDFFNLNDYRNEDFLGMNWAVRGYNFREGESETASVLIYYTNLYFQQTGHVFYKNKVYKKAVKSKYSYKYLGTSNYVLKNLSEILNYLKERFKIFDHFEVLKKVIKNIKDFENILKNSSYLLVNEKIYFNILEFKDGLYFLDYDYFVSQKTIEIAGLVEVRCFRNFDVNYKKLNIKKWKEKSVWLKKLSEKLKNEEEVKECCIRFGEYFSLLDEKYLTEKNGVPPSVEDIEGLKEVEKVDLLNEYLFKKEHKIFYEIFMLLLHDNEILPDKKNIKAMQNLNEEEIEKGLKTNPLYVAKDGKETIYSVIKEPKNYEVTSLFFGKIPKKEKEENKEWLLKKRLYLYKKLLEVNLSEKNIELLKKEEIFFILYCTKLFIKTKKQTLTKKQEQELLNFFKIKLVNKMID